MYTHIFVALAVKIDILNGEENCQHRKLRSFISFGRVENLFFSDKNVSSPDEVSFGDNRPSQKIRVPDFGVALMKQSSDRRNENDKDGRRNFDVYRTCTEQNQQPQRLKIIVIVQFSTYKRKKTRQKRQRTSAKKFQIVALVVQMITSRRFTIRLKEQKKNTIRNDDKN